MPSTSWLHAQMEQRQRDRAKRAATKGTNEPLFAEDGRVRALLEKYDEEDAGGGMRVNADGALEAETARRQEEIRRRLAAGARPVKPRKVLHSCITQAAKSLLRGNKEVYFLRVLRSGLEVGAVVTELADGIALSYGCWRGFAVCICKICIWDSHCHVTYEWRYH